MSTSQRFHTSTAQAMKTLSQRAWPCRTTGWSREMSNAGSRRHSQTQKRIEPKIKMPRNAQPCGHSQFPAGQNSRTPINTIQAPD